MNSGNANKAAVRLLLWSVVALLGLFVGAWVGRELGGFILAFHQIFIALWAVFVIAILYLSRDPDPIEPSDLTAIVSPAHGKVDVIEKSVENDFVKGPCQRVSIGVSLFDVQVQYAPVSGTVAHCEHRRAVKEGGAADAETLLVGLNAVGRPETRVAVRLMGGRWGRRILPWVRLGDVVARGARIGMMRPASRVDLYLPVGVKLSVNLGDEVAGGQSVVGKFE